MVRERCSTRWVDPGRTPGCRSSALKLSWWHCRLMLMMTGCVYIMRWQPTTVSWATTAVPFTTASKNYCCVAAYKAGIIPTP